LTILFGDENVILEIGLDHGAFAIFFFAPAPFANDKDALPSLLSRAHQVFDLDNTGLFETVDICFDLVFMEPAISCQLAVA